MGGCGSVVSIRMLLKVVIRHDLSVLSMSAMIFQRREKFV